MHYSYKTENTCSTLIEMEIERGVVSDVRFTGGCNGNLKAIPILVNGMKAEDIAEKLSGVTCGRPDDRLPAETNLQKPFLPRRKRKKKAGRKLWINTTH